MVLPGQVAPQQLGSLQLTTFINPTGLESKGENLYVETGASGNPQTNTPGTNGTGVILQGYVESSNVNVVEEMVNMIQTQRAYEINSKAITTSELGAWSRQAGLSVKDIIGLTYNPLTKHYKQAADVDVNYMIQTLREE